MFDIFIIVLFSPPLARSPGSAPDHNGQATHLLFAAVDSTELLLTLRVFRETVIRLLRFAIYRSQSDFYEEINDKQ